MKSWIGESVKDHKDEMIALRKAGKTYIEIGKMFGVSKQRGYTIISESCSLGDKARRYDVDIENIVYEGIYALFANDYKMTISKFARIVFDTKRVCSSQKELIRRFVHNYGDVKLTVQNIRNICEYIGEPFERVFKVRR
jgi:hypothetical protein